MEYKWLNQYNNDKVIVFFNGWGLDESVVKHLCSDSFDVLMFYDYNSLNTNFDFKILNLYSKKYLIAWSMGVMCASLFNNIIYDKKVAINGTLLPIDARYGINPKIYELTINGFGENSCQKFVNNMFDENDKELYFGNNRTFENVYNELIALKNYKPVLDFKYDDVLISNNDKIIPTKNQSAFWNQEPNLEAAHCPFFKYTKWSELL